MLPLLALLPLSLFASVAVYYYFWNRSQYFKRRGIPGPSPSSVFTGNLKELQKDNAPPLRLVEWEKEYGGTYGIFEGGNKTIVTSDLEILQDIFVRKFENFYARKTNPVIPNNPDKHPRVNMFNARGLRWKRLRTITNPTFSASKLKAMEPTMQDSIRALMHQLEQKVDEPFDVYPLIQELTLDVIERTAFGKKETQFGQGPNPFIEVLRKFFNPPPITDGYMTSFFASTCEFLAFTTYIFKALILLHPSQFRGFKAILDRLEPTVLARRQEHATATDGNHTDFIDLFLNAEADDEDIKRMADERYQDIERKHMKVDKKLTIPEIVGQCFVFLVAGYDTTANTLAYLSYNLAVNDDAQNKLIAEIDDFLPTEDDITYESVQNLTYLDWCMKENLRMNPLASFANQRLCMKGCTVGEQKLQVEEGVVVQANVWSIHYNKKIWGEDVDIFRPERFDPETLSEPRHPLAWQPFGAGPRICIGMRFALLEAKMTVCHLLKRFCIQKCDKTSLVRTGNLLIGPKDVTVILKKRT
uniref:Cytochrome P450 n=1 Tax=Plectus sambesii TaxID=2011161 RepID=A0A914VYX4_9BILA